MTSVVELPIFPLADVVLFPRLRVPLHIFEPRYRQMTEAALAGDRRIGMVAVLPAQIASLHGNPATYPIGCTGIIEDHRLFPDGRYNIVLLGTERFRIRRERPPTATRSYRIAEVELLEEADAPEDGAELLRQGARLAGLFSELMSLRANIDHLDTKHHAGFRAPLPSALDEIENAVLTNTIASPFHFTSEEKQGLLEEAGRCARLERLCALLRFAIEERHSARVPDSGFLH